MITGNWRHVASVEPNYGAGIIVSMSSNLPFIYGPERMFSLRRLSLSIAEEVRRGLRRGLASTPAPAEVTREPVKDASILVERIGEITKIGINCPEKKNCLDRLTAQNLSDAIEDFEQDKGALVAVLHGIGGNFCSGYDLEEIAKYDGESEDSVPQFGPLATRTSLPKKPMIAALSGFAVGAGFELALMCDLRVMEDQAIIGLYNRRFGVPILSGGTVRLPAVIGYSRAMDLILTGRGITAEEAFSWGLANRLVACGTALGQSMTLATCLLKFSQRSMLADRQSAHNACFHARNLEEALQFEKDQSSHLLLEEGVEGAKKFLQGIGKHGKFSHLRPIDRSKFDEINEKLL